jgi:multiple sugar transport system substrate-binding protein
MLRELTDSCGKRCLNENPIAVWEAMSSGDETAYCPFAYGYSNYARARYAKYPIQFGGLVSLDDGTPLRSTLGGAGLAISKHTRYPEVAAAYAAFVASEQVQRGVYFESGGQPGHRKAWTDVAINGVCADFFERTLATLDNAYLRPRFDGYLYFQDHAGEVIYAYLRHELDLKDSLMELDSLLDKAQREGKETSA